MKTPTIKSVIEEFGNLLDNINQLEDDSVQFKLVADIKSINKIRNFIQEKINSILDAIQEKCKERDFSEIIANSEGAFNPSIEDIAEENGYNQHCKEVASKINEIRI